MDSLNISSNRISNNTNTTTTTSNPNTSTPNLNLNTGLANANWTNLLNILQQLLQQLTNPNSNPNPRPNTPSLQLNDSQNKNLRSLLGLQDSSPFTVGVLDKNGNGKLNAGDVAVTYGGITGGEVSRHVLTAADIKAINGSTNPNTGNLTTLNNNEAKWKAATANGNYDYTVQYGGFTAPEYRRPITVSVNNGQVSNMTYADTGEAVSAERQASVPSMSDLFQELRDAYKNNAAQVNVTYDATYGYPSSLYIDRSAAIADEEVSYSVSNVRVR
jgi:hypothetical protein